MSTINGTSGDDVFPGTPGDDTIDGGAGQDTIDFSNGSSNLGPQPSVTIDLMAGTASGPDTGNDTLISIENVVTRGYSNSTIIGDDADNHLTAFSHGSDFVSGGNGDDFIFDDPAYGSTLNGGAGVDELSLDASYQLVGFQLRISTTPFVHTFTPDVSGTLPDGTTYSNFEYYQLGTGDGDDVVTFTQLRPATRSPFGDIFIAANGWSGGRGNDTAIVDLSNWSAPLQLVRYNSSGGLQRSFGITAADAPLGIVFFLDVENYQITAGSGDDSLAGDAGDDIFTGGGGNDVLDGDAGNDIARYSGLSSQYQITALSGTTVQIKALRPGSPDGTDTLTNIEKARWSDGSYTKLIDSAPVLTIADVTSQPGQVLALSSLFQVSDPDGDTITQYQVIDATSEPGSGHFVVAGVTKPADTVIDLTPAQLAQTSFVTGTSDYIQIRAFDGTRWSETYGGGWSSLIASVPNTPPVTFGMDQAEPHFTSIAVSGLLTYWDVDPDGIPKPSAITKIQLLDTTSDPTSGHFVVNGVAQAAGTVIDVTATQLAQTFFVTGKTGDTLQARGFDGTAWSAPDNLPWAPFTISIVQNLWPSVQTQYVQLPRNTPVLLSSLFSVNDADGDAITAYQVRSTSSDPLAGTFSVNGVAQPLGAVIDITPAQMASATFSTGVLTNMLEIRAFDGIDWSAPDNAPWSPFTINVVVAAVSIGNASVTEGGVLHFGVTLDKATSLNITLGYDTFAGTASMADNDYLGGTGTLTIQAGQTTGTINIQTVQDTKVEPDETMSVHLLTTSFGAITQAVGTGTIVNSVVPNITIGNASVTEGGVLHFGVTLDAATAQNITLGYDTFAGTASMADNDYLGGPAALTILAGQTSGTINIQTVQDSKFEPDETMSVHLLTASFGNITQGVGTGTIVNDDAAPVVPNITIGNASVTEGGVLQFGVTLDQAASQNITLGYDTFAGTASMANNDYLGGPAALTILAGQMTGTINIQTVQDSTVEPDETMSVHLLTASFGNITQGVGTGTIVNDDAAPVVPNITIGNASVTEGGVLQFGVTLDQAASQNITLGYDTFAGTASMANNDYLGGPGTLTILAGQTTGAINIQTVQDAQAEPDETMSVHLLAASFGNITQGVGTGTIVNDDAAPVVPNITIGNASVTEGGVLHFGVTLDQAVSQNITLGYDTFAGTASMANNDYLGGLGTLTILAGQTTGTINIQTVQDSTVEPDETMSVHLLAASFGNITQAIGTGTIVNDDVVPNISIGNASAAEGNVLHFGVTLDQAASQNITLGYDTFFGTASMANNDYLGGPGTLTILAGQTTGTINIQTVQDGQVEPDETMSVDLLTASFGNIAQGIGTGTILSNSSFTAHPGSSMTPLFGTHSLATTLAGIS